MKKAVFIASFLFALFGYCEEKFEYITQIYVFGNIKEFKRQQKLRKVAQQAIVALNHKLNQKGKLSSQEQSLLATATKIESGCANFYPTWLSIHYLKQNINDNIAIGAKILFKEIITSDKKEFSELELFSEIILYDKKNFKIKIRPKINPKVNESIEVSFSANKQLKKSTSFFEINLGINTKKQLNLDFTNCLKKKQWMFITQYFNTFNPKTRTLIYKNNTKYQVSVCKKHNNLTFQLGYFKEYAKKSFVSDGYFAGIWCKI